MKKSMSHRWDGLVRSLFVVAFVLAAFFLVMGSMQVSAQSSDPEQSGSVGVTGTISAPPPTQAATISSPGTGQTFTDVPIPITGLCPDGLLVKLFKNNVFAGATQCVGGSYEIIIDLFPGTNDLVARVFDDLDQAGPDSNVATVEFVDNRVGAGTRVSVTSNYAKRGANPSQTLTWPIVISGGDSPYAVSVDWGDGTELELISRDFPGSFDISHTYELPGVYNIVVQVTDVNGVSTFLQIVGVANGIITQANDDGTPLTPEGTGENITTTITRFGTSTVGRTEYIWWPALLLIPFIVSTFWLGKRYMLHVMKKRIQRGEHPFTDI